jgi:hypothetical protein
MSLRRVLVRYVLFVPAMLFIVYSGYAEPPCGSESTQAVSGPCTGDALNTCQTEWSTLTWSYSCKAAFATTAVGNGFFKCGPASGVDTICVDQTAEVDGQAVPVVAMCTTTTTCTLVDNYITIWSPGIAPEVIATIYVDSTCTPGPPVVNNGNVKTTVPCEKKKVVENEKRD